MKSTSKLDIRRRMSLERLALCHVATAGHGPEALAAAAEVTAAERSGLLFGQTFADTLALSRPLLDLFEEAPTVRRLGGRVTA